ncbi:MAG: hypothetical protein N3A69_12285, partial [Leptospiraceae bacterium]|nr:hypothetical protein [Leptospiraceae bacterium]
MKIFFLVFLVLGSCIQKMETDPTVLIRLILKNQELVTLKGKVSGPGTVKNATVSIIALPSNGRCVTEDGKPNGNILASTKTNELGEYTLSYTRTNSTPCLVVTGGEGATMEVNYGNKKPISWSGNHLFSVFQEPRSFQRNSSGQLSASKTVNANPFTRLASSRFLASRTAQNASKSQSFSTYLRSLFKKSPSQEELLESANKQTLQTFFKGMNSKNFKLEETNPDTKTFQARLGAIQTYAEKVGLPKGAPKSQYNGNI